MAIPTPVQADGSESFHVNMLSRIVFTLRKRKGKESGSCSHEIQLWHYRATIRNDSSGAENTGAYYRSANVQHSETLYHISSDSFKSTYNNLLALEIRQNRPILHEILLKQVRLALEIGPFSLPSRTRCPLCIRYTSLSAAPQGGVRYKDSNGSYPKKSHEAGARSPSNLELPASSSNLSRLTV